jgi:hypothetical protein
MLQSSIGPASMVISWEKANDNKTAPSALRYRVVYASETSSIGLDAAFDPLPASLILGQDWSSDLTSINITGLSPATSYLFAIFVKDVDGEINFLGPQLLSTAELLAPTTGTGINFSLLSSNSVRVNWGAATDTYTASQALEYRLVRASSPELIDTVAEVSSDLSPAVTLVQDWTPGVTSIDVTGLSDGQTYSFAVVVKASPGNYAVYQVASIQTLDITAPSSGGNLLASLVTNTSARLSWSEAIDNTSAGNKLFYKLVTAQFAASIDSVTEVDAIAGAQMLLPPTAATSSFDISGLTPGSPYYFNVLVTDEANNKAIYSPLTMWTTDNTPPTPGTALSFTSINPTSMTVNWGVASDANPAHTTALLEYKVVRASSSSAIDSLSEINAITSSAAGLVSDWTPNITSVSASGLNEGQTYFFAVAVRDPSSNYSLYTPASQSTSTRTRYIFRSAAAYDGNLGGISGADTKCNTDGGRPDPALSYKALLVDGVSRVACTTANCSGGVGEHINWILRANTPYKNAGGVTVGTTDSVGLFSTNLIAQINVSANNVWTGLASDYTSDVNRCTNWSSNTNGSFGRTGSADQTSIPNLISLGNTNCATTVYLYCVEI